MLTRTLVLAALIPLTLADVQFTSPAAGTTLQADKPITANWKDSGDGTALKDLETYALFLCAGGNDEASIIQSVGAAGEQVINYSNRFTISGMTGTFAPNVAAAIEKVSGTDGPPSTSPIEARAQAANGKEAVSYTAETGPIKYAPMMTPPGTKITAKNASPRYPTSSVPIAKTFLPTPKQSTTVTASLTMSAESHPFKAPAASQPADDMQKFLHRWRD
ncbi:MAG: hypothetical protein Q9183_002408 [Haloplaca sp. 2 TL-2023]